METVIRKVSILDGVLRVLAKNIGAEDNDLVLINSKFSGNTFEYNMKKIDGDPVSFLMRKK